MNQLIIGGYREESWREDILAHVNQVLLNRGVTTAIDAFCTSRFTALALVSFQTQREMWDAH